MTDAPKETANERTKAALATQKESSQPEVVSKINDPAMIRQFQAAMPKGLEATRLVRDAMTAIRSTPKLVECDAMTVLGGLMTCAQLGLRPGVMGQAWLLPFWSKRTGRQEAQLIIGYQGYVELAQRSGMIKTLVGRAVYENDIFDIEYGIDEKLVHKPELNQSRGKSVGYYCVAKYTTGGYNLWYMSKPEAEEHRDKFAMARTKDGKIVGPWVDHFDSMAIKTCFLRLVNWMPKSTELGSVPDAIQADNTVRVDLDPEALTAGYIPSDPEAEL